MSNQDGMFTSGASQFDARVNSIPLSDVDSGTRNSIGALVSDATSQMSSLVRSEIELAKTELAGEAKKGAIGGGLFGVAGVVALYSSFFFFFFLAELLADLWLDRWAAFLVVFLIMLVLAAIFGLIGFAKVKKIGKPKETIRSVNELKNLVPGKAQKQLENSKNHGLYS